jgi:hypothetical protein
MAISLNSLKFSVVKFIIHLTLRVLVIADIQYSRSIVLLIFEQKARHTYKLLTREKPEGFWNV